MPTNPIGAYNPLPKDALVKGGKSGETEKSGFPAKASQGDDSTADKATTASATGEKVQISQAGRDLLELTDLMSTAKKTMQEEPDIRADRIREVRERLKAGVYDTKAVKEELAHRLSSILKELPIDEI